MNPTLENVEGKNLNVYIGILDEKHVHHLLKSKPADIILKLEIQITKQKYYSPWEMRDLTCNKTFIVYRYERDITQFKTRLCQTYNDQKFTLRLLMK